MLGLFVTADSVIPDMYDPQQLNRYAYCRNNPLKYTDPDGHVPVETILDVASLIDSAHSMYKDPSWANAGWLAWDVVGMIPYVPGSWAGKVGKYGAEIGSKAGDIVKTGDKIVDAGDAVADGVKASKKGIAKADDVIHVTPDKVALPKGPKYKIPDHYIESPHGRVGDYGEMVNGKFKAKLRIDPATPPGKKGPNYTHYHKDGKKKPHYSPRPGDKDTGF